MYVAAAFRDVIPDARKAGVLLKALYGLALFVFGF
jgi:hypothetical protein